MAKFSLRCLLPVASLLIFCCPSELLHAQARFDLAGPKIDVRVTRGDVTLPIAAVPNLLPGDQIWLHPAFPPSQSVKYLLIVVFLRGTTNPPPDSWFTRIETWQKNVREEGVYVTVPKDAQQAILFLAPETGGDFGTLRSAVKGSPGIFVRASQDLAEAGFEQARIERYLAEIKQVPAGDSVALQQHSDLLARTLNLKPNPDCFKKTPDQQYTCLTQTGTQTLLDDGHGQTVVAALSNGSASDFIQAASATSAAGGGLYSAYVGAIVDLVRLTSTLHTAQYRYIPAIAFPDSEQRVSETLNLRLNTPPSFHNPKSVIVIGLPAVQPATLPPLRPADPSHISCLLDPHMVLPIEGAPLVFSTSYAHDLVLHLNLPPAAAKADRRSDVKPSAPPQKVEASVSSPQEQKSQPQAQTPSLTAEAQKLDLPIMADPYQGGLTLDPNPSLRKELPLPAEIKPVATGSAPLTQGVRNPKPATPAALPVPGEPITGTIEGYWGFDHYTGPTLPLQNVPGQGWKIVTSPETPEVLIAGQPNHLQLTATGTACVESIALEPGETRVDWKLPPAPASPTSPVTAEGPPTAAPVIPPVRPIEVTLNLQKATTPGDVHLAIQQFGEKQPDQLGTKSFAEPAKIESFRIHAGDLTAALTGNSLDQVKSLTFSAGGKDLIFTPTEQGPGDAGETPKNTLALALPKDTKAPNLKVNEKIVATVHLQDGRVLQTSTLVMPSRPSITILSRRVSQPQPSPIQLNSPQDLPLGAQLTFFLKSQEKFPRNGQVEIASKDVGDVAGSNQPDTPLKTTLSIAAGTLVMQDSHTILATFDPLKTFGPSTFGQFHVRAIAADGTHGEWLPLATIVRLPTLTELHCPAVKDQVCQLSGSALYLIDSIATDAAFTTPTAVPEGFVDAMVSMPRPQVASNAHQAPATFYIRLRDDPTASDTVTLPLQVEPPPAGAKPKTASPAPTE